MKIGIIGTGAVGQTIGTAFAQKGHSVKMGSRTATNEKAAAWVKATGANASQGTFADAAAFAEVVFNCTKGEVSLAALNAAGANNLQGKILVDVANPLDFSKGMPPILTPSLCNTTSLGEEIQKAFPRVKVVKALNTMNCKLMANPSLVAGKHDVFICGNDVEAKATITHLLEKDFGWPTSSLVDMGDITSSRATEMLLPIWIRLMVKFGNPNFNFSIVK